MYADRAIAWVSLSLLLTGSGYVGKRIFSEDGLPLYWKLDAQLARVEGENEALTRDIERLSREVKALSKDPDAVERVARDELGLLHEGEILFQFPVEDSTFLTAGARIR